jgi:hypothetical protein
MAASRFGLSNPWIPNLEKENECFIPKFRPWFMCKKNEFYSSDPGVISYNLFKPWTMDMKMIN